MAEGMENIAGAQQEFAPGDTVQLRWFGPNGESALLEPMSYEQALQEAKLQEEKGNRYEIVPAQKAA